MQIDDLFGMSPWPWQSRGVEGVVSLYDRVDSVCLQSPTGGGKSNMMWALVNWGRMMNFRVGVLTNRISLCDQLHAGLKANGIDHGVVAASMRKDLDLSKSVQLIMVQSEIAQMKRRHRTQVDMLIVDEAHLFQSGAYAKLIKEHKDSGTFIVQVTATPIGLYRTCDEIVIAGTNSELREHGAHVPCFVKAPCEVDFSDVQRKVTGEFVVGDVVKKIWNQQVVGHVYEHWAKSNPDREATICFGPDCASSLWLAQEFEKRGVSVAHVESNKVYWDGQIRKDPKGTYRKMVFDMIRNGEVQVLFNRFVCREGIDIPCLRHAILATPIGSLKSYVQTVGRLLRYSKQTPDHVYLADHGGSTHDHGHPDEDRDWERLFRMTEAEVFKEQKERKKKEKPEEAAITCPNCKTVRMGGSRCPDPPAGCGQESSERKRFVIQTSGELKAVDVETDRDDWLVKRVEPSQQAWDRLYWGQVKSAGNLTFQQLAVIFCRQHGRYPPATLKNMPKQYGENKSRRVYGFPKDQLVG